MENQKMEDLLLLSLQSSEEERIQSQILNVGYDRVAKSWELIVKFHGNIQQYEQSGIRIRVLTNGYAVIEIQDSLLGDFVQLPEIEYVEMPKSLLFEETTPDPVNGQQLSCIYPVKEGENGLTGKGVLIGIIDSGIDIFHSEFRNPDGTTRILAFWDQTPTPEQPEGIVYSEEQINQMLAGEFGLLDESGHGTAVASIAAGSTIGVANESRLIVVKMGNPGSDSFPRTTQLMRAMDFCNQISLQENLPMAANISYGNCYGNHQGDSLLERYMDNQCEIGRNVICVGSGNEGVANGHFHGFGTQEIEVAVGQETALNLQIWKHYQDDFQIILESPRGFRHVITSYQQGVLRFSMGDTQLSCYIGDATPYSVMQEIYLGFFPKQYLITSGIWRITMNAISLRNGNYDLYLPGQAQRSLETRFYASNPSGTITIPATTEKAISVGAYRSRDGGYADFSGRGFPLFRQPDGYLYGGNRVKPEISAPGEHVLAAVAGGGYGAFSGTSFAVPYVTGSAALLMEWGIVRGNDRFLYGQKLKACLIAGANLWLAGEIPNEKTGWGKLCLSDSFPVRSY